MLKHLLIVGLLITATAADAHMHSPGVRDDTIKLCKVVATAPGDPTTLMTKAMDEVGMSYDEKDYVYDMCVAYIQGRIDASTN